MNIVKKKPSYHSSNFARGLCLIVLFFVIGFCIFVIHKSLQKKTTFHDNVASQIAQEMAESHITLSSGKTHRTVADFKEPIILSHGNDSRLVVYTTQLSETVSISDEGLFRLEATSVYQDITYAGNAQYTVNLSQLAEEDFVVNNELKTLTVRIPYAVLSPINIPGDQIKCGNVKSGIFRSSKDIEMTTEQHAQLLRRIEQLMKAKLIDNKEIDNANAAAKKAVTNLLSATVHSIDPEFTVVIVQ